MYVSPCTKITSFTFKYAGKVQLKSKYKIKMNVFIFSQKRNRQTRKFH